MNKKGFTLIEVLAVIILLGILSIFSVTAITKIVSKQKNNNYKNTVSATLSAARKYFSDNLDKTSVSLKDLHSGGYLEADSDYIDVMAPTSTDKADSNKIKKESCASGMQTKIVIYNVSDKFKNGTLTNYNDCGCDIQSSATQSDGHGLCN